MKISHSKVELYNLSPRKYYYKYVLRLEPDKTFTPLLFGGAIDNALNYVLESFRDHNIIDRNTAKKIFLDYMAQWSGQNELVFFKSEMPKEEFIDGDVLGNQIRCWTYLCKIGQMMLDTYIDDILPLFEEVIDVQIAKEINNQDGDQLVMVLDFTAKLKDGRQVTFDNKTTGDVHKNYPDNSVKKSQQLSLYAEFEPNRTAGYIALSKKLTKDGKVEWKYIIDEIPEEQSQAAFERVDQALRGIKKEEWDCKKGCEYAFHRKCEYYNLCKHDSDEGLIKKPERK